MTIAEIVIVVTCSLFPFLRCQNPHKLPYLNVLFCKIRREKPWKRRCEKGIDYIQVAWLTLFIRYLITIHYDYRQLVKFHRWPHYCQLKVYL